MNRARTGWVVSALLLLLVLVTCDGGAPGDADGGPPPGSAACVPGELTLPDGRCQPAGLPLDMACPPGQRALPASADGSCQPAGVPAEACAVGRFEPDSRGGCEPILPIDACPPGQMAVPGERACREVAPCGEGPWNAAIPQEATPVYVDQGYSGSDSDGSREKPWKTVQRGIRAALPGAIVAVAAGRYMEDVLVSNKPVRLWGRCPERTVVVGRGSQTGAIALWGDDASGSEVRGLAVTGPSAGIFVRDARSVLLEEVWVHKAGVAGVFIRHLAGVTLRGVLVEQNDFRGVVIAGSEVTIEATVVRANQPDGAGRGGYGISIQPDPETGERGKLSITASLVEENQGAGVVVLGSEATVEATVVRATQPNGAGAFGIGIGVKADPETGERGKLSLTASLIEENHYGGVEVAGAEATIEATVVRATQPNGAGAFGIGIGVKADPETGERGKLSLTASLIEENHYGGVEVAGAEATIEATVVRATQPDSAGAFGIGIGVKADPETGERGKLSLTASLIEENHYGGVLILGSEATVEGTVVRATQPNGAWGSGRGINVQADTESGERGRLSLMASLVEENHEAGVFVGGSEATIEATVVRATQPDALGNLGRGINVQEDTESGERGRLSLTASLVEENHQVGVLILGSEATVEGTVVRATKPATAGLACGDGIVVVEDMGQSSATIAATASTDNARAGVIYVGSTGELASVWSSGNRFGLVLRSGTNGAQPTLVEGNAFEGNTEQDKLAEGDLPVPDAALPVP